MCEALKTNRTLTTLDIDGDLNDAEVGAFGEALQMNPAIVTLRFPEWVTLGQEALAALSRNRELPDFWASVARVVLRGGVPELRAVVDAMSPKKFQEDVFRFFCPPRCFRVMSDQVVEKMLLVIEEVEHAAVVAVIDSEMAELASLGTRDAKRCKFSEM